MLQNFSQLLFLVLGERCFQNPALESFEFLQYPVRGNLSHQNEKGRGARLESLTEFLHEIVTDADITQFACNGSGAGTDSGAQKRVEK